MAELESQPVPASEIPETVDGLLVNEVVLEIPPPNRPRKVSAGMWGPLEIASVAIGALALAGALAAYFMFVLPSDRELARNRSEADRLEAELASAKSKYGEITDTQTQVGKLVESVDDFETRFLPMPVNGQTALYQRLNGLIAAYDLVNTTGPDYAPLETAELNTEKQTDEDKGRAKYRSLYPGVYVSTTLEGSYQNLRRFIREIETGREFIIVSSVELAPSDSEGQKDQKGKQNPGANVSVSQNGVRTLGTAAPASNRMVYPPGRKPAAVNQPGFGDLSSPKAGAKGKMHGETVSLHIELAAYFRRSGSAPVITAK